jgi:hypothetical protein
MILFALVILTIYLTAKIDAEHYLMGHYFSDHKSRFLQRGSIGLIIAYFAFWKAIAFAFLFWALFDGIRNYLVGKDIFYIGETSYSDLAFRGKLKLYIATKVIALIIAIALI